MSELIPVFIYVTAMMIISLLGNGITCFIFGYKLRQTVTRNFIFALALLDLISSLICMPSEIYFLATITSFNYPEVCKFFRFLTYVFHSATSLILLAIAWDRFYKVCRPLKLFFNVRRSRIYCVASIVLSLCIASPSLILYGTKTLPNSKGTTCSVSDSLEQSPWPFIFYLTYFICFACIAVAMVILYTFVIKQVKTLRKEQKMRKHRETSQLMIGTKRREHAIKEMTDLPIKDYKTSETSKITDQDVHNTHGSSGFSEAENEGNRTGHVGIIPEIRIEEVEPVVSTADGVVPHINNRNLSVLQHEMYSSVESVCISGQGTLTDSEDERNDEPEVTRRAGLKQLFSRRKPESDIKKPQIQRQISKSAYKPGKTTRMLLTVTLCFVLSFLPFFVVVIIRSWMKDAYYSSMNIPESIVSNIIVRSYLVSNAVNPIIYGILNTHFRLEVKKILKGKFSKSSRNTRRLTLKMSGEGTS